MAVDINGTWEKVHDRGDNFWKNAPDTSTPLDEVNLNEIEYENNTFDDRILALKADKVSRTEQLVKNIVIEKETGIITVIMINGAEYIYDTKLEKIAVNFSYDEENERLVITLEDGTEQYVDLSSLITEYEFENSEDVNFTVEDGKVKAFIPEGSITPEKLEPNYLANVQGYTELAKGYKDDAKTSADNAKASEEECERIERELGDVVVPMGTLTHAQWLETIASITLKTGYMWNISTDFVTDETFIDEAGKKCKAGTNVLYLNGMWDTFGGGGGAEIKQITYDYYIEHKAEIDASDDAYIVTMGEGTAVIGMYILNQADYNARKEFYDTCGAFILIRDAEVVGAEEWKLIDSVSGAKTEEPYTLKKLDGAKEYLLEFSRFGNQGSMLLPSTRYGGDFRISSSESLSDYAFFSSGKITIADTYSTLRIFAR